MGAGRLRHLVTIEEPTAGAPNAYGEIVDTWSTFATVRAAIVPQTSREFIIAQQVRATITHLLDIRALSGINSKMRVKFGTRYLHIEGAIEIDERNRMMRLACVEAV